MKTAPGPLERALILAGWSVAGLALVTLAVLWGLDRAKRWDAPRWPERDFVALRSAADSLGPADETWVVSVNLACPHCRASLAEVEGTRDRHRSPIRIAALLVDTPKQPAANEWSDLLADEVWWDETQRWREKWGRRVYGEVLCFGGDGAFVRQLGPLSASESEASAP